MIRNSTLQGPLSGGTLFEDRSIQLRPLYDDSKCYKFADKRFTIDKKKVQLENFEI